MTTTTPDTITEYRVKDQMPIVGWYVTNPDNLQIEQIEMVIATAHTSATLRVLGSPVRYMVLTRENNLFGVTEHTTFYRHADKA